MVRSKCSVVVIRLILALSLVDVGCGGGNYSPPAQPSPQPSPHPSDSGLTEPWEIFFQSDLNPGEFIVLEASLSQTGEHLSSEANGAAIFQGHGTLPYQ